MKTNVKFICETTHKAPHHVSMHKHNCNELVCYLSGNGSTTINSKQLKYKGNSIALIPAETNHDEYTISDTHLIFIGFESYNIQFDTENYIHYSCSDEMLDIVTQIAKEFKTQRKHYQTKIDCLMNILLIELDRQQNDIKHCCKDLNFTIEYIKENYNRKISLPSLAKMCGYSYDHFRHLFKSLTSMSPQEFLIKERIKAAKHMLTCTNKKVTDIADLCGFFNSSQMCMLFKKYLNTSPQQYRNSNKIERN